MSQTVETVDPMALGEPTPSEQIDTTCRELRISDIMSRETITEMYKCGK